MSAPATVVLFTSNPLQGPRKLLEAADRIVVETRDPELALHALTTMAVPLWVCDLSSEKPIDYAAMGRAALAANPGLRILFCGPRAAESKAQGLLSEIGAEGAFAGRPWSAVAVRRTAAELLRAAQSSGAGAARPAAAAAPAAPSDERGPDPDHYEIVDLAGKGGTGTVYRALDRFLGIEVAIKVINPDLLSDPDVLTSFKDEARITMQLSHRNILRLYSFQVYNACHYIVMEFVHGTALRDSILASGALAPVTVCQILMQCADALEYAHAHNVVHKDIKPENIFLTDSGELKIVDFGSAVLNDARSQEAGAIVGTPEYMPPEQLRGDVVGPSADIYALGIMTYLMLVGCFPFPPNTTVDDLLAGVRPDFSALTPELAAVLAKATSYEAEFRYESAAAFARDVVAVCGCEQAVANPWAPIQVFRAQIPDPAAPAAEPLPEPAVEGGAFGSEYAALEAGFMEPDPAYAEPDAAYTAPQAAYESSDLGRVVPESAQANPQGTDGSGTIRGVSALVQGN